MEPIPARACPVAVTADADLAAIVRRLSDAAGVAVDIADDTSAITSAWTTAPLVLVGVDRLDPVIALSLPRRDGVIVLATDLDDATIWRRAVNVGAEHVAFPPDAEPWLIDRLADSHRNRPARARLLGVVGGRGGAGATTVAVALALAGVRRGLTTMLLDADPLGGGIDLLFGGERTPGARWPEVIAAPVTGPQLIDALPKLHDLTVLSWDRNGKPAIAADEMTQLLGTSRATCDLLVIDLPRSFDAATVEVLTRLDRLLIVVPAEVRACASARRISSGAAHHLDDSRIVVRGPAPSGLRAEDVADAVGLPLAGWLPGQRGIVTALESGFPPGANAGPLARLAERILADFLNTQQ